MDLFLYSFYYLERTLIAVSYRRYVEELTIGLQHSSYVLAAQKWVQGRNLFIYMEKVSWYHKPQGLGFNRYYIKNSFQAQKHWYQIHRYIIKGTVVNRTCLEITFIDPLRCLWLSISHLYSDFLWTEDSETFSETAGFHQ